MGLGETTVGWGGGQMAPPLNFNAENLRNADFFLVFKSYVYFLWASASELQPKTCAKNSAVLKAEENFISNFDPSLTQ